MPVQRDAGNLDQAQLDRRVAGDVAAALEHLTHLRVVDVASRNAGPLERLTHRVLREIERADVEKRALASGADRRASGGDDDGVGHDHVPFRVTTWCTAGYLTPVSAVPGVTFVR